MFWQNLDQARQRLQGSVVMYGNKPIRFGNIDDRECSVRDIETGKTTVVNLDDEDFDDFRRLPPMGFVNVPGMIYHLRRLPIRSQSHGLVRSNVSVQYPGIRGQFTREGVNYDYLVEKFGQYYAMTCRGEFPTFEKAVSLVRADQPIAFTDKYAVVVHDGMKTLYRDDVKVGVVADKTTLLSKPYLCLREELQEAGVTNILEM